MTLSILWTCVIVAAILGFIIGSMLGRVSRRERYALEAMRVLLARPDGHDLNVPMIAFEIARNMMQEELK
jgi:hypothetical protein